MANAIGGPCWIIDTASATALYSSPLYIAEMRFVPASAGDDVIVQDANGVEIWRVTNALADGIAGIEEYIGDNKPPVTGLLVPTLTSGAKLYVWPR